MKNIKDKIVERYTESTRNADCCPAEEGICCSRQAVRSSEQAESVWADSCESWRSSTPLGCGVPLRYAGLRPGDSVLDLGSGPGIEALQAARAVGAEGRVIGVDLTPEMIAAARSRAERQGVANVDFILADIESLPLGDDSIDVVISNCVINLAPDKRRVFAEMYRVLKPGGRFSIADVVSRGSLPASVRDDPELWSCCVAGAIEEQRYLEIVQKAGFRDIKIRNRQETGAGQQNAFNLVSLTIEASKPQN